MLSPVKAPYKRSRSFACGPAFVPEAQGGGRGQVAAGRIAADREAGAVGAELGGVSDDVLDRGNAVIQRRRGRVLGAMR